MGLGLRAALRPEAGVAPGGGLRVEEGLTGGACGGLIGGVGVARVRARRWDQGRGGVAHGRAIASGLRLAAGEGLRGGELPRRGPRRAACGGEGRRGRGGRRLTTSTMNGSNHSLRIQARAGREWERGGERVGERRKRERGGFSLPRSWVREKGEWGVGRARGKGQMDARQGPG
jgi:hypothetical protein